MLSSPLLNYARSTSSAIEAPLRGILQMPQAALVTVDGRAQAALADGVPHNAQPRPSLLPPTQAKSDGAWFAC